MKGFEEAYKNHTDQSQPPVAPFGYNWNYPFQNFFPQTPGGPPAGPPGPPQQPPAAHAPTHNTQLKIPEAPPGHHSFQQPAHGSNAFPDGLAAPGPSNAAAPSASSSSSSRKRYGSSGYDGMERVSNKRSHKNASSASDQRNAADRPSLIAYEVDPATLASDDGQQALRVSEIYKFGIC